MDDSSGFCKQLIGLPLNEARAILQNAFPTAPPLRLTETAPPQPPQRNPRPPHPDKKRKHADGARPTPRTPREFGEWRVLHCRIEGEQDAVQSVEIFVAREEVKPRSESTAETTFDNELNL
jgi:hypothetical protein